MILQNVRSYSEKIFDLITHLIIIFYLNEIKFSLYENNFKNIM